MIFFLSTAEDAENAEEEKRENKLRPLAKIAGTGSPARPTKIFFLVGWASSPFQNLIKTTFARGLLSEILAGKEFDKKQ
ncbi:hypothetical protein QUB06_00895 [Microcoleus sp. D2_18a_D3]